MIEEKASLSYVEGSLEILRLLLIEARELQEKAQRVGLSISIQGMFNLSASAFDRLPVAEDGSITEYRNAFTVNRSGAPYWSKDVDFGGVSCAAYTNEPGEGRAVDQVVDLEARRAEHGREIAKAKGPKGKRGATGVLPEAL